MKYFVIRDGGPAPTALARVDQGVVEVLTGAGQWVESGLSVRPEPGWTSTEVEAQEFYGHVHRAMCEARAGLPCLASFSSVYHLGHLGNATAVMRRRDGVDEWLDQDNVWRAGERDLEGQIVLPVSEEELESLKWEVTRPSWFVVHDDAAYPYAVVRKIPSAEEAFTRDLRWEPSDLLGRVDLRVEELSHAIESRAPLEALEIGVRAERLRVRGGPEYFTVENRLTYVSEGVFCVIRRTDAGEEVHTGHSGWIRSELLGQLERGERVLYRHLPVSEEEGEAIIAERSGRRWFLVLDDPGETRLPVAVVGVDGEREEAFTRDLVWGPSDLLARMADEPGLWVEELPAHSSAIQDAFWMASRVRHIRQRDEWSQGEHWYFAVFRRQSAAFDLANAHRLHRTKAGRTFLGENYENGGWTFSRWALEDTDRGKSDDEYLPISPEEARTVMTLLDNR